MPIITSVALMSRSRNVKKCNEKAGVRRAVVGSVGISSPATAQRQHHEDDERLRMPATA
jgi:hypothetical protein